MLAACIVYSGIIALTEWVRSMRNFLKIIFQKGTGEYAEKRKSKRHSTKVRDMSLPLMEFEEGDDDLIINDIEASVLSSGVSSARYEEQIPADNQKRVNNNNFQEKSHRCRRLLE